MNRPSYQKTQLGIYSSNRFQPIWLVLLFTLVFSVPTSVVNSQCDTVLALSCETAPLIPLENYCGRTNLVPEFCCTGFCGPNTAVHNPTYHEFIALETSILIEIMVLPCDVGIALQAAIIPTCPWVKNDILDCNPGTPPGESFVLESDGIIPGESYWLLIDGYIGAMCNFLITNVEGAFQPETPIINLQSNGTTLTAIPAGNYPYTYAWFECEANEVIGTEQIFEAPEPGCYCVTVRDSLYASTFCTTVTTTSSEEAEDKNGISIHPNPSSSEVDIVIPGYEQEKLTLKIFDYQGRCIKEETIQNGTYRHVWQDGQAAGMYLFVFKSDNEVIDRKRVVFRGS